MMGLRFTLGLVTWKLTVSRKAVPPYSKCTLVMQMHSSDMGKEVLLKSAR
jgi:hypothetical protein